jgi:hypothetical protein
LIDSGLLDYRGSTAPATSHARFGPMHCIVGVPRLMSGLVRPWLSSGHSGSDAGNGHAPNILDLTTIAHKPVADLDTVRKQSLSLLSYYPGIGFDFDLAPRLADLVPTLSMSPSAKASRQTPI